MELNTNNPPSPEINRRRQPENQLPQFIAAITISIIICGVCAVQIVRGEKTDLYTGLLFSILAFWAKAPGFRHNNNLGPLPIGTPLNSSQ